MNSLHQRAFRGVLFILLVMASLLFGAAGTFDYWQAWTFLAVYFASCLALTLYLMKKDPKLLERPLRGGPTAEKEPAQGIIMYFASAAFITLLVVPALVHHFRSTHMPAHASLSADPSVC